MTMETEQITLRGPKARIFVSVAGTLLVALLALAITVWADTRDNTKASRENKSDIEAVKEAAKDDHDRLVRVEALAAQTKAQAERNSDKLDRILEEVRSR